MSKHYLFDFDGVLADSMPSWLGIHMGNLREAGIPIPNDFVETITPLGNTHGLTYLLSLGLPMSAEDYIKKAAQQQLHAYQTDVQPKPFVAETLKRLKGQGISLHVLTANDHTCVEDCLQRWHLFHLFDRIFTIDDFGLTKNDPELFQQAAERLGADLSDCTMLDDNIRSITTAKQAGMHTIGVYDESSRYAEAAMRQTAEGYIRDFSEL